MISPSRPHSRIVVVDSHPNDYDTIAHSQEFGRVDFQFHRDGRSVLRDENEAHPELCVINMNLPDMSGLDLYDMLADRWPGVPMYLVGDDYRPEDEVRARSSGATFYFCKPLQREWLAAATIG
jgi:DNA-binding response OmpR family regulator